MYICTCRSSRLKISSSDEIFTTTIWVTKRATTLVKSIYQYNRVIPVDRHFAASWRCRWQNSRAHDHQESSSTSLAHFASHREITIGTLLTDHARLSNDRCQGRAETSAATSKVTGGPFRAAVTAEWVGSCFPDDACRALADFQPPRTKDCDSEHRWCRACRAPPQVVASCRWKTPDCAPRELTRGASSQRVNVTRTFRCSMNPDRYDWWENQYDDEQCALITLDSSLNSKVSSLRVLANGVARHLWALVAYLIAPGSILRYTDKQTKEKARRAEVPRGSAARTWNRSTKDQTSRIIATSPLLGKRFLLSSSIVDPAGWTRKHRFPSLTKLPYALVSTWDVSLRWLSWFPRPGVMETLRAPSGAATSVHARSSFAKE